MDDITDEEIDEFLNEKGFSKKTIRQDGYRIKRVEREDLTYDRIWKNYQNHPSATRRDLRRGIRLLEEFTDWRQNDDNHRYQRRVQR